MEKQKLVFTSWKASKQCLNTPEWPGRVHGGFNDKDAVFNHTKSYQQSKPTSGMLHTGTYGENAWKREKQSEREEERACARDGERDSEIAREGNSKRARDSARASYYHCMHRQQTRERESKTERAYAASPVHDILASWQGEMTFSYWRHVPSHHRVSSMQNWCLTTRHQKP